MDIGIKRTAADMKEQRKKYAVMFLALQIFGIMFRMKPTALTEYPDAGAKIS
ncbi:MAG: hypothetical protein LUI13_10425 [Lachnospiraceae bacterium]|nr:hypothetical protein [Lachnospiraceae bacterium]